jgi:hypothetical protein
MRPAWWTRTSAALGVCCRARTGALASLGTLIGELWVPKTSSASRDQAIFVDQATGAGVSSHAVLLEIDRFG